MSITDTIDKSGTLQVILTGVLLVLLTAGAILIYYGSTYIANSKAPN